MRISAKGEYAAKAVLCISQRYPEVVTIREISRQHGIPTKFLEQILIRLKRAGILQSRRGVRGGYTLARAPGEISVGEVLQAVDGNFAQASCLRVDLRSRYACPERTSCGLKQTWREVQDAVEKILFTTTFEDLCRRTIENATGTSPAESKIQRSQRRKRDDSAG